MALREIPARLAHWRASGERDRFLASFRRFRAFDRANVLHLFATFRYDGPFAREHPEAVQVGPLWPGRSSGDARPSRRRTTWLWYASPASAETIAPTVLDGLERAVPDCRLVVRTPRTWTVTAAGRRIDLRVAPIASALWRREFRGAALRIVTGSRSLLEALELGGPFLYFNGLVGTGPSRRRHRPEKIIEMLRLAHATGWPSDLCHDLDDFSRGLRLASVVERAARRRGGWQRFPRCPSPVGLAPGYDDAGTVLLRFAGELAAGSVTADELVARTRAQARP